MPDYNTPRVHQSRSDVSAFGKLVLSARQSPIARLASNLRDFLVDHPARGKAGAEVFANAGFGAGVGENLKEFFKSGPQAKSGIGLMSTWDSGFGGFRQNLRELFSAPRMPVGGERVPEIWSKNPQLVRAKSLSVAIHVVALALMIGPMMLDFHAPSVAKSGESPVAINLSRYNLVAPAAKKNGTGGGGQHDNAPARRGQLPPFQKMQLAAPKAHPLANQPVAVTPTLLADSAITPPHITANTWGNSLSKLLNDSMGGGDGNGLGDGKGNGGGGGDKYGYGKDGVPAGTRGYGNPACLYCPNAQFSDEAVKAKYQGVVLVAAVITPDGRATNVRVVKGLGLGLDENAVAAVSTWRFRPATGPDGKPAAVLQTIEVEFRLI